MVITGDKGLAGAYNHNVLKLAESYLARKKDPTLFLIGQMGRHYFEKKHISIDGEFMYTAQDPTLERAREIVDTLVGLFEQGALDDIYLVFTHTYSAMRMEPERPRSFTALAAPTAEYSFRPTIMFISGYFSSRPQVSS